MKLMAIRGPSCHEAKVAAAIVAPIKRTGLSESAITFDSAAKRTPEPGDVGNLIVRLPGSFKAPRRLLSAHMDTVPVCIGSQPSRKGRLVTSRDPNTGLGADNRAGCAVILTALLEILRQDLPHPPVTFCWFVQEEIGLQGARCVNRQLLSRPKMGFNFDGGSPAKLTVGATGGYRMKISVSGIAAHAGGAPERGVSAITVASLAIADLERNGWLGRVVKKSGVGTSNVGAIHGGAATNVVTDDLTLLAEARSHDPKFRKKILNAFIEAFERAAKRVKNENGDHGKVTINDRLDYESYRLKNGLPCVEIARLAGLQVGLEPELAVANGGLDANWLNAHGIPTVSIGCGQINQHMTHEALDLDGFDQACKMGLILATAAS